MQQENDNLKAELAWFRRKMFGSSSERRAFGVEGQLSFIEDEEEKPVELIEPEIVEKPKKVRKKKPTLEERPSKEMSDDQLEKLAPWNVQVQEICGNKKDET